MWQKLLKKGGGVKNNKKMIQIVIFKWIVPQKGFKNG